MTIIFTELLNPESDSGRAAKNATGGALQKTGKRKKKPVNLGRIPISKKGGPMKSKKSYRRKKEKAVTIDSAGSLTSPDR